MEAEYAQYMAAVSLLDQCGIPRKQLFRKKTELYSKLADSTVRSTRSGNR